MTTSTVVPITTPKPPPLKFNSTNVTGIETTSFFQPDTTAAPPTPEPGEPIHFLTFVFRLPITAEAFSEELREHFITAIASVAQVPRELVTIETVEGVTLRRLLAHSSASPPSASQQKHLRQNAVDVAVKVMVPLETTPEEVMLKLTAQAINLALVAVAPQLQGGSFTQAPTLGDEPVPCGLPTHQCVPYVEPGLYAPAPTEKPDNVTVAPDDEPEGTDLGPCICDLTVRVCDANCECDPDCVSTELDVFSTEYGVPDKQENAPEELPICVSGDTFLAINSPMRLENSPLCVTLNNNPSVGNFFVPPGPSVLNDKVRVEFNALGVGPWVPYEPEELPDDGSYMVGMRIHIAYGRPETPAQPGLFGDFDFLSLPYPGSGGKCTIGNFVRYWDGTPDPGPCSQGGPKEDMCSISSMLSAKRYLENLFIAIRPPGRELAEWSGSDSWVSVDLSITVEDQRPDGSVDLYTTQELPGAYFDGFSNRCVNVLKSLTYILVRDGNGGISSAKALVTLAHVAPKEDGSIQVLQDFGVRFLDSDTAALDTPNEQATIDRSGNPGYVDGKPVLAGLANSEAPANPDEMPVSIEEMLGGLVISRMSGPDGMCSLCAEGSGDSWVCDVQANLTDTSATLPVLFNENLQQGCLIKLTRAQLQDFCRPNQIHPLLSYDERLRIGIWGNADTRNYFDWLPNSDNQDQLADTSDDPTAEQAFDPRGDCQNVVDAIHYQFLTADVGNVKNPQRKILGARVTYGRSNWLAQHPDLVTPAYYSIKTSVSFVRLEDGGSVDVIPDPPSILPMLPDDIFYPFLTGGAARLAHGAHCWVALGLSGLAVVWLQLRS